VTQQNVQHCENSVDNGSSVAALPPATKGNLTITGLDGIFGLADGKFIALATLQMVT